MHLPWVEKYRPKVLDDVVGHKEIVERLKSYVKMKDMPNLLFSGRPGVGKTTVSLAMAHELYSDNIGRNFLELNASDDRGIDTVRGKIKDFARTLPLGEVPFKIIFLDEADALTSDAQQALRRTMENYAGNTRFILSCNYSSKIIEPIQSRCAIFRFRQLSSDEIISKLKEIAISESLNVAEDAYAAIVYTSEGDMRKAINILQGASLLGKEITKDTIFKVSSQATPQEVKKILELALSGKFTEARGYMLDVLVNYGLSGEDILIQMHKEVQQMDIPDPKKLKIIDAISEFNFRIVEGANDLIQLDALLARLAAL